MKTSETLRKYKPNTNIKGIELVIPDVNFCPCCGLRWVYLINAERWLTDELQERKFVTCECKQVTQQDGETIDYILVWKCARCGYRHQHSVS